jgi:hypothetical protein
MAWPDVPCPCGPIPTTARNILDYIINKAMAEHPPNETLVVLRAERCKLNMCVKPWGNDDTEHCKRVQRAKFFADAGQWYQVANELEHIT